MTKEEFLNLKEDCTILYLGIVAKLSYVNGDLKYITLDSISLYYSEEQSNKSYAYFRISFFHDELCFKLFYEHCSIHVK